jgi:hypothetical protein
LRRERAADKWHNFEHLNFALTRHGASQRYTAVLSRSINGEQKLGH